MQAEIKIDPAEVQAALVALLERQVTPEQQKRLIADAIGALVKAEYHHTLPPIKEAFRWAAERAAKDLLEAEFKKPERIEQIEALVRDAVDKALGGEKRQAVVDKLSTAIGRVLIGSQY